MEAGHIDLWSLAGKEYLEVYGLQRFCQLFADVLSLER